MADTLVDRLTGGDDHRLRPARRPHPHRRTRRRASRRRRPGRFRGHWPRTEPTGSRIPSGTTTRPRPTPAAKLAKVPADRGDHPPARDHDRPHPARRCATNPPTWSATDPSPPRWPAPWPPPNSDPRPPPWFRRFYTDPDTGQLAATDSKPDASPTSMREFLLVRDRACRTPYCHAPGRHDDHQHDHAHGGPTTLGNGQLTCEALQPHQTSTRLDRDHPTRRRHRNHHPHRTHLPKPTTHTTRRRHTEPHPAASTPSSNTDSAALILEYRAA